jgi:hypothetical protein
LRYAVDVRMRARDRVIEPGEERKDKGASRGIFWFMNSRG